MKVFLRLSGGFGNLRLEGEVDTTVDLPADACRQVEKILQPKRLEAAAPASGPGLTADLGQVRVGLAGKDYVVDEAQAPPELLEVLDTLRLALTRKKMKAAGRE